MGAARDHGVRLMGLPLAALAVLAGFLAIGAASQVGDTLRAPPANASVTQSSGLSR